MCAVKHNVRAELESRLVPIANLNPWPRNPRDGDIPKIKHSLEHNGQYKAILGRAGHNTIIAGNQTLEAAHQLGWTHVAVDWLDVDEATARRIMLVDNRTSDFATYKDELLLAELHEIGEDLTGTGYTTDDLDELERKVNGDLDGLPEDSGTEDDYHSRFEVVVECRDEDHQQDLYERFQTEGLDCRVLSM